MKSLKNLFSQKSEVTLNKDGQPSLSPAIGRSKGAIIATAPLENENSFIQTFSKSLSSSVPDLLKSNSINNKNKPSSQDLIVNIVADEEKSSIQLKKFNSDIIATKQETIQQSEFKSLNMLQEDQQSFASIKSQKTESQNDFFSSSQIFTGNTTNVPLGINRYESNCSTSSLPSLQEEINTARSRKQSQAPSIASESDTLLESPSMIKSKKAPGSNNGPKLGAIEMTIPEAMALKNMVPTSLYDDLDIEISNNCLDQDSIYQFRWGSERQVPIFENVGSGVVGNSIKMATLPCLLHALVAGGLTDHQFLTDFLRTYRYCGHANDIARLLILTYFDAQNISTEQHEQTSGSNMSPEDRTSHLKLRVLNVLKKWINEQGLDFKLDSRLAGLIRMFLGVVVSSDTRRAPFAIRMIETLDFLSPTTITNIVPEFNIDLKAETAPLSNIQIVGEKSLVSTNRSKNVDTLNHSNRIPIIEFEEHSIEPKTDVTTRSLQNGGIQTLSLESLQTLSVEQQRKISPRKVSLRPIEIDTNSPVLNSDTLNLKSPTPPKDDHGTSPNTQILKKRNIPSNTETTSENIVDQKEIVVTAAIESDQLSNTIISTSDLDSSFSGVDRPMLLALSPEKRNGTLKFKPSLQLIPGNIIRIDSGEISSGDSSMCTPITPTTPVNLFNEENIRNISSNRFSDLSTRSISTRKPSTVAGGSIGLRFILEPLTCEKEKHSTTPTARQRKSSATSYPTILNINPDDLAQQLTLIESKQFHQIPIEEFYCQAWSDKLLKNVRAPHLVGFINWFNHVALGVASEVVRQNNIKFRVEVLKKWIYTAEICMNWGNYNTCFEIVAGLNMGPISRLKKTWKAVPKKFMDVWKTINQIVSSESSYKVYRTTLKNNREKFGNIPILPYIGVSLADLTFAEDGNATFIEEPTSTKQLQLKTINFSKLRLISSLLNGVVEQQKGQEFHFNVDQEVQTWILDVWLLLSEADLYACSKVCEPRIPQP